MPTVLGTAAGYAKGRAPSACVQGGQATPGSHKTVGPPHSFVLPPCLCYAARAPVAPRRLSLSLSAGAFDCLKAGLVSGRRGDKEEENCLSAPTVTKMKRSRRMHAKLRDCKYAKAAKMSETSGSMRSQRKGGPGALKPFPCISGTNPSEQREREREEERDRHGPTQRDADGHGQTGRQAGRQEHTHKSHARHLHELHLALRSQPLGGRVPAIREESSTSVTAVPLRVA